MPRRNHLLIERFDAPEAGLHDRGLTVRKNGGIPSRQELSDLATDVGIRPREFAEVRSVEAEDQVES